MKTAEREEARLLRRESGLSIKQIARQLGVAPSSVSRWVHDVELTAEQHAALRAQNPAYDGQRNGSAANAIRARERRRLAQGEGRLRARHCDSAYAAGCMLFWAEGSRAANAVQLTNADPELMRFFIRFLRSYFRIPDARFRVECHLFADDEETRRELEDVWLSVLALPRSSLTKTQLNALSKAGKGKRPNALPYGTCRLTVHETRIAHILYGSIQELAGFTREAWERSPANRLLCR